MGPPLERRPLPGLSEIHHLDLEAGDYAHVVVEQLGIDVSVLVRDPGGRVVTEVDSPNGERGPEPVFLLAELGGRYRLEVMAAAGDAGGAYRIVLEVHRPAGAGDRRRVAAASDFFAAESLRRRGDPDSLRQALTVYRQAAAGWSGAGETVWEAVTLERLARIHRRLGGPRQAILKLEAARRLLQPIGEAEKAEILGEVLLLLGRLHRDLGAAEAATAAYEEALELARAIGDRGREAALCNNLALLSKRQGETYRALGLYRQALEAWRQLDDRRHEALVLRNIGMLYTSLGHPERAREHLLQALDLIPAHGRPGDQARALAGLAKVERRLGRLEDSRRFYLEALRLHRQRQDRRGELETLLGLAQTQARLGVSQDSLESYRQAAEGFRQLGDAYRLAVVELELGWLHLDMDRPEAAQEHFARAGEQSRATANRLGEASALHGLARCEALAGRPAVALGHTETALAAVESLRGQAGSPSLRASFLDRKYDYYVHLVDVLLQSHAVEPEAGFDRRALAAAERARARAALDLLQESLAEARLARTLNPHRPRGEGRDESLLAAAGEAGFSPPTLGAAGIQQQLDDRTALLAYTLGERRSYLWWVTAAEIEVHSLAPRADVEDLAATAHRLMAGGQADDDLRLRVALAKLARILLRPVAARLDRQHLVVIPDGALHYLPFAALPLPPRDGQGAGGETLIARHQVSRVSSASVLAMIRRRQARRAAAGGTLAVLADPVFQRYDPRLDDPRLAGGDPAPRDSTSPIRAEETTRRIAEAMGWEYLPRLTATAAEAATLETLTEPGERLIATGFDASRGLVTSGALADYRILHFATHSLIDPRRLDLSGLVLSQFDREGRTVDGLLRVHEIYELRLAADLVVLSACRTALGRELRGEGLLGLTQAFLYAGAASVLVSLWDVDDRATAKLMELFYRQLLETGASPPAALRAAQLALREVEGGRWAEPFYWAGFVLEGEWSGNSRNGSVP